MWQWWTLVRSWCALSPGGRRARRAASRCAAEVQILDDRRLLSASNPIVPPLPTDVDLSQTFLLASRPAATKTIFLDFDGSTTSGTYWNSKYTRGAEITTPPYSIDADPAFSDDELTTIQCIWQRVAEDFAPFDINVTTIEPSSEDLVRFGAGDERWGMRVNIGGAYTDWLRRAAGGIAVINSFGKAKDVGAFVFVKQRAGEEKYTADCISHEVGHTLGLTHKGAPGSTYYSGHGSGETGWAPLMGAAYDRALSQWSKGEYHRPTSRQDELKVITTGKGVNYRDDDFGGSWLLASPLPVTSIDVDVRRVQISGVIERNTDQDWFAFATRGGPVAFDFDPVSRGANLDILASLYDASGTLIASSNPADRIDAHLEIELPAGVYYIMVDGVGARGLADGYSDYGSLGQYTISGSIEGTEDPLASGWITGSTWHDADGDGHADPGDTGLNGITVFLDLNDDGSLDPVAEPATSTDEHGRYYFSGLAAGDYVVRALFPDPWLQIVASSGPGRPVTVSGADLVLNVDFTALIPPALLDEITEIQADFRSRKTLLTPDAIVTDLDTTTFSGTRLVAQFTSGNDATDRLFLATGRITLVKSTVRIRGKIIGKYSGGTGSTPLIVTFNASATPDAIETVLQSLAYRTTALRPAVFEKAIAVTLFEPSGASSNSLQKLIRLIDD
jgi:hypothetical protein